MAAGSLCPRAHAYRQIWERGSEKRAVYRNGGVKTTGLDGARERIVEAYGKLTMQKPLESGTLPDR